LTPAIADSLAELFEREYMALYGRVIPGVGAEILTWTLTVSTSQPARKCQGQRSGETRSAEPAGYRAVFDTDLACMVDVPTYDRADLKEADRIDGPALIVEDQTTTVVPAGFAARVDPHLYLVIERDRSPQAQRGES
jgi:N-methylhydantoinase A